MECEGDQKCTITQRMITLDNSLIQASMQHGQSTRSLRDHQSIIVTIPQMTVQMITSLNPILNILTTPIRIRITVNYQVIILRRLEETYEVPLTHLRLAIVAIQKITSVITKTAQKMGGHTVVVELLMLCFIRQIPMKAKFLEGRDGLSNQLTVVSEP